MNSATCSTYLDSIAVVFLPTSTRLVQAWETYRHPGWRSNCFHISRYWNHQAQLFLTLLTTKCQRRGESQKSRKNTDARGSIQTMKTCNTKITYSRNDVLKKGRPRSGYVVPSWCHNVIHCKTFLFLCFFKNNDYYFSAILPPRLMWTTSNLQHLERFVLWRGPYPVGLWGAPSCNAYLDQTNTDSFFVIHPAGRSPTPSHASTAALSTTKQAWVQQHLNCPSHEVSTLSGRCTWLEETSICAYLLPGARLFPVQIV